MLCLVGVVISLNYSLNAMLAAILVITLLYIFFLFAMSMLIQFNFYIKTINENTVQKIALTFDDGPHPVHTLPILNILDELNVKAVFFMIGKNVKDYPEIAKEVSRRGHQIGVHSQNHAINFGFMSDKKLTNELKNCVVEIEAATGFKPVLFRPPFGVTNPKIAKAVWAQNLITIGWSIRSFDTVTKSADVICKRIVSKLKGNSIVLLHDRMPLTVIALPLIIQNIRSKGLEIGKLTI